jgi:hypothetical protein
MKKRCHPEAGEARRETSQAVNRLREIERAYVISAAEHGLPVDIATVRSLVVCATRDDSSNAQS